MLLRLPGLLAFMLPATQVLAQTYEPGWLVKANGDTLRGELENGFQAGPPTFIDYRASAGSPSLLFLPRQLRAVIFAHGRYYRLQVLPIDHAACTNLNQLPAGNFFDGRPDTLLAEVLVEEPVMLRRGEQEDILHLLVRRPGQPVQELAERRYLRQLPDGRWLAVNGNNYRSQLTRYFGDLIGSTGRLRASYHLGRYPGQPRQ